MDIPEEYCVQKYFEYCGGVKFLRLQNSYIGSCAICREGKSWLKKKRCYYLPNRRQVYCHNCGWSSSVLNWLIQVTNLSRQELIEDSKEYDLLPASFHSTKEEAASRKTSTLPEDCINLFDDQQVAFYKHSTVVFDTVDFIKRRRLDVAVNRPKTIWLSLTDYVHKNRLVIPFYDAKHKIVFYQTRGFYQKDLEERPKYLSKINGDRTLYGINNIDPELDSIYIFEGPINAFFCKNGVAVAGIQEDSYESFTPAQKRQLQVYPLHKKIWVLDSQWIDRASLKKTEKLISQGENVFIWPRAVGIKYKDFNDIAIDRRLNELSPTFVNANTVNGFAAELKLAEIKRELKSGIPLETLKAR